MLLAPPIRTAKIANRPHTTKLSKQKNAPFWGKFQGCLKMREIGSVADDLDVGAILEGRFMHIAPFRDAHFGETGVTTESQAANLLHRWGDDCVLAPAY